MNDTTQFNGRHLIGKGRDEFARCVYCGKWRSDDDFPISCPGPNTVVQRDRHLTPEMRIIAGDIGDGFELTAEQICMIYTAMRAADPETNQIFIVERERDQQERFKWKAIDRVEALERENAALRKALRDALPFITEASCAGNVHAKKFLTKHADAIAKIEPKGAL